MPLWIVFSKKKNRYGWTLNGKYIRTERPPNKDHYPGFISMHGPYLSEKVAEVAANRAEKKILDNWDKVMKS